MISTLFLTSHTSSLLSSADAETALRSVLFCRDRSCPVRFEIRLLAQRPVPAGVPLAGMSNDGTYSRKEGKAIVFNKKDSPNWGWEKFLLVEVLAGARIPLDSEHFPSRLCYSDLTSLALLR